MDWSQIIGLGGLALLAALGFQLMSGGKKVKRSGRADTESIPGERDGLRHGGSIGSEISQAAESGGSPGGGD